MKDYLPLFNTNAEYEAYKNNSKKLLLPNVSYVQEDGVCYFNRVPIIYATYNATSENMLAINNTKYIKSLKIDGVYVTTNGGLTGSYYFETEGVHEIEIELTKYYIVNDKMFYECTSLTEITIPDSVTSIGEFAFRGCSSLTSINIPDGVTEIGYKLFENCSSLTSIDLGNSVTSIGESAFERCSSLTEITIPDSVTSIGHYAFRGCTSLTSVVIPEGVTSIGESAFYNCSKLTSITIPEGVTSIGYGAFSDCESLTSVTIPNSVTSISHEAFYQCYHLTEIIIPNSVTTIGDRVFYNCTSLRSVTVGNGVTYIGEYVFSDCTSLANVYCKATTPPYAGARNNKWKAFDDNAEGRRIHVPSESVEAYKTAQYWSDYADAIIDEEEPGNKIYYTSSDNNIVTPYATYAFGANIVSNTYENGLGVITFDSNVSLIATEAFYNCKKLTSITIPDSVTSIWQSAFDGCTSLVSVYLGNGVTSIGINAFYKCTSLTSITIPNSVTSIDRGAFYYCQSLTEITIPGGVTSIDSWAFNWCSKLTSVYCKATTPPTLSSSSMFDYNAEGRKIYVPMESVDAYKSAEYWSSYADVIEGYNF